MPAAFFLLFSFSLFLSPFTHSLHRHCPLFKLTQALSHVVQLISRKQSSPSVKDFLPSAGSDHIKVHAGGNVEEVYNIYNHQPPSLQFCVPVASHTDPLEALKADLNFRSNSWLSPFLTLFRSLSLPPILFLKLSHSVYLVFLLLFIHLTISVTFVDLP